MDYDLFIGHSSEDAATADDWCTALEHKGLKCWIAPRNIGHSPNWARTNDCGIADSISFLLLLSGNANASPMVQKEVIRACELGKEIYVLLIEDVEPSEGLALLIASSQRTDAFGAQIDGIASGLVRALKGRVGIPNPKAPGAGTTGESANVGSSEADKSKKQDGRESDPLRQFVSIARAGIAHLRSLIEQMKAGA